MVEAYIHIRVEAGKGLDVLKQLRSMPEVREARPVTGPYDLIVKVEVANTKALTELLVSKIHKINGIRDTTTSIILD
ncbi:MAG: Lrp/AsnC ligand binding domain-containing protein [Candidatus Nezhaarchaeota archaeon]|nr:Lrp/AsnC ligand binding domain-containing protein [Candidatus Nezhaarchaeota archaeon]